MKSKRNYKAIKALVVLLIITVGANYSGSAAPSSSGFEYIERPLQPTPLQNGLQAYRQNNFRDAIEILATIDDPIARLFLAKSNYAIGNYAETIQVSTDLSVRPPVQIANEAQFLMALSHYQRKEFYHALELLYVLKTDAPDPSLREESLKFYQDLLKYLTASQRIGVVQRTSNEAIRRDVLNVEVAYAITEEERGLLENLIRQMLGDPESKFQLAGNESLPPPTGTIYRIGILLPGFDENEEDRIVSRGLYNGLLLAADEFNRQNDNRKISLKFTDTEKYGSNLGQAVTDLIDHYNIDFIVGPLFSEQVSQLSGIANRRQVPLFAPLANSITLSRNNEYVFQMNPSFEARGMQYAEFLVENRGKRRIGVITETNSFGEIEAKAFRDQAISLGAEVPLFFSEDFSRTGFSTSHILPWFANDIELIQDTLSFRADSLDAVFLSFTSDVAETLLDNTLTGLEAFLPDYTILTNETLSYLDHSIQRIRRLELMYSDTNYISEQSESVINFRYDYRNRTGFDPSMFSYLGYDIGKFIVNYLDNFSNPANFVHTVPQIDEFEGLSTRIYFGADQMNQSLQFFRLTTQGIERVSRQEYIQPKYPDEESQVDIEY
ncbi:MAG: amino acid ABC transporter substrate-binding protein [Bacteroidetes bacterium]|nr:amino acid ABC transporter substrate-binding protein [Bacteroidota bacterium]